MHEQWDDRMGESEGRVWLNLSELQSGVILHDMIGLS